MPTLTGLILDETLRPVRSSVVHAFDRDMRHAEPLGKATTDRDGRFAIEYSEKQFRRAEKNRADLFVRVLDPNGRELYESETRFNAADVEVFEIELDAGALCHGDEYSSMCVQIAGPIENVPVAELTDDDLAFLARETGLAFERLRLLRLDALWSCEHGLPRGLFYAMFRQGLPTVWSRLLAHSPARWRAAVKGAIAAEIVPSAIGKDLEPALERLEALADEVALADGDGPGGTRAMPAVATVAAAPLTDDQRKLFARTLRKRGAIDDDLWTELECSKAFGAEAVAGARFALAAEPLALGHLPTLRVLDRYRRQHGWTDASDLARLSRQEWHAIAESAAPDDVTDRAAQMAHNVEVAFPTMTIARHFERDSDPARADVARFLVDNPGFDVLRARVDTALNGGAVGDNIAEPEQLAPRLKAVARAARIVANPDRTKAPAAGLAAGVGTLLDNGFDSARKVVNVGRTAFVGAMAPHLGAEPAEATYDAAVARVDAAEMLHEHLRDYARDPIAVIPTIDLDAPPEDWSFLFEGPGGCACKHCRSVLSPSAYLADLLRSLEESPGAPYVELVRPARRPDIPRTRLSCANANTTLPYIDLVNEILADALMDNQVSARDTSGDAAERRAIPEHVRADADAEIAARRPAWQLPFEAGHVEATAWAEHLGLDLADVSGLGPADAGEHTRRRLGIGPALWRLLTEPSAVTAPASVAAFLDASGLSHAELLGVTRSWFFSANPAGALSIDDHGAPCDLSRHEIVGLVGAAEQLERYVRLARHLGMPLTGRSDLDAAIEALAANELTADTLAEVADVLAAATAVRRSVRELAEMPVDELLGLGAVEVALLARLAGVTDTFAVRDRVALVGALARIESSGLRVREVANILLGWDQAPSAFFPSVDDARSFLALLSRDHQSEVDQSVAAADSDPEALAAAAGAADRDAFLLTYYGERLIVERLAEAVGVDSATVDRLVRAPAAVTAADRTRPAIADFVDVAAAIEADDPARYAALVEATSSTLARLGRAARLVRALRLSAADVSDLSGLGAASGILGLDLDPASATVADAAARFEAFGQLADAAALSRSLPAGASAFALMANAADWYTGDDLTDAGSYAELAEATGWPASMVADALSGLGAATVEALGRFETYARLAAIVGWTRRYRVDAATVLGWAAPSSPAALAASLRETAQRRAHAMEAWYAIATPVNDRLREGRRDALLAAVIERHGFDSPADVYAHYLIDPEMSACQLTSRIKLAVASVQLYIQRLLMGIDAVVLDERSRRHWDNWSWAKNYRVWEANRKVFLFPENWLYSELRDGKSEAFVALENALLQDDVSDATGERALGAYVDRLDEVGRLDLRAVYVESAGDERVLHLFGRTRSHPHAYFHRRRNGRGVWTAWEKIDLPIDGDHLVPFASDGRIVLFWVSFRGEERDGETMWKLELSWAERRDGGWGPVQTAPKDRRYLVSTGVPPEDHLFRVAERGHDMLIEVYRLYREYDPSDRPTVALAHRALRFNRCDNRLELVEEEPRVRIALLPPRTTSSAMHALEVDDAPAAGGQEPYPLRVVDPGEIVDITDGIDLPGLIEDAGGGLGFLVALFLAFAKAGDILGQIETLRDGADLRTLLGSTPGAFRMLPAHQGRHADGELPFAVELESRTYLVTPTTSTIYWTDARDGLRFSFDLTVHRFETAYHPYVCEIVSALSRGGLDALLAPPSTAAGHSLDRQLLSELPTEERFAAYMPTGLVVEHPYEQFEFGVDQAYGLYNWELFFHAPLLIAEHLTQNQRFEEARRWLHFIFDPTDVSGHRSPQKFWRTQPLYLRALKPVVTIDALLEGLARGEIGAEDQIEAWRDDPFNPHAIARLRTLAYMRAAVMKYLDNLIAWGDDLYGRDTIESLNEATQLYVLAAEILGDAPEPIEAPERPARSYEELGELDAFGNALEDALPAGTHGAGTTGAGATGPGVPRRPLYFCVPDNEKLAGYRVTIADRLAKIRTCLDVEGRFRQLPLFEPPIDPGLLVRARAAGLDLRDVLSDVGDLRLPHQRYGVLAAKAVELCGDVRALGNALAAALERKDAEEMTELRARHEVTLLARVSDVRRKQIDEARESLEALRESKRSAETRKAQLDAWISEDRNPSEKAQIDRLHLAHGFEVAAQTFQVAAAALNLIPESGSSGVTFGGRNLGHAASAASSALGIVAGQYSFEANMASLEGGHKRRAEEWSHQSELAAIETEQLDRQILGAEIRVAVAETDESNHRLQLRHAEEVEALLRTKFTSRDLYAWQVGQLSKLYRDSYRAARDLAVRAERAACQELGLSAEVFRYIGFDHYDSLRRGLLAGEKLHHDLRRLDAAHLERNRRELEMTKHVSLAQLNPEQLFALRETGACSFNVPELVFDMEFPGHYRRRIRSVSVTIPAVTGPTTNVGAVLTLDRSWIRTSTDVDGGYARNPAGDDRFIDARVAQRAIATSTANRDAGVFELNFRDERYLPFEGAGVDSVWTLELPAAIRPFDYDTISDVILHVSYSASEGATAFRRAVTEDIESGLRAWVERAGGSGGLVRVFSLRRELSSQLHQLLHPVADSSVHATTVALGANHVPYFLRDSLDALRVTGATVIVKLAGDPGAATVRFGPSGDTSEAELGTSTAWGGLAYASVPQTGVFAEPLVRDWELHLDAATFPAELVAETGGVRHLRADLVEDVYIALRLER